MVYDCCPSLREVHHFKNENMNEGTREFWELVVLRIQEQPDTIQEALNHLNASLSIGSWCYDRHLADEWIEALNGGYPAISPVLLGLGLHFDRLRQCCPPVFRGLISDDERWLIHIKNR